MPITIRHIKRLDAGYTGASRTLLGRQFEPMGTTPYNDGLGWQGGAYTTRVYEEGDATLLFPNAGGSDAVQHRNRFGITKQLAEGEASYDPGNEFVDVLPSQLTLQSASATAGAAVATIPTNTVTWNGSIPAGGSVTITINAVINAGTGGQTITNQGTINFDADGNGTNESTGVTDDPSVAGSTNPTSFAALDITQVPTLNEVGLAALCLLLAGAALLRLRRRTA